MACGNPKARQNHDRSESACQKRKTPLGPVRPMKLTVISGGRRRWELSDLSVTPLIDEGAKLSDGVTRNRIGSSEGDMSPPICTTGRRESPPPTWVASRPKRRTAWKKSKRLGSSRSLSITGAPVLPRAAASGVLASCADCC